MIYHVGRNGSDMKTYQLNIVLFPVSCTVIFVAFNVWVFFFFWLLFIEEEEEAAAFFQML